MQNKAALKGQCIVSEKQRTERSFQKIGKRTKCIPKDSRREEILEEERGFKELRNRNLQ